VVLLLAVLLATVAEGDGEEEAEADAEAEAEEAEVGGDVIGPARAGWGVGLLVSRKMGEPGT